MEKVKRAAKIIREGGLVAFPTETVYGLGADALNPRAVARIFEVKNRPHFDPIIVHIADSSEVKRSCSYVGKKAERLMEKFWPGPLSLVLPKSALVPGIVTAGLPTVAIRMPSHPMALDLIKEAKTLIAAPSANLFGYLSPTTAEHVKEQLRDKIEFILNGGECPIGVESTVISLAGKKPLLLRHGGVALENIENVIGKVEIAPPTYDRPPSPGQLPKHYSPRTPIKILTEKDERKGKKAGLLAFTPPDLDSRKCRDYDMVEVLSSNGDLVEAAANFFSCLHRLDNALLDIIYAEPVPEVSLGRAIMDRLHKAAGIK